MPRLAQSCILALSLLAFAAPLLASDASAQQQPPAPAPAPASPPPASPEATNATVAKVQAFYDTTTSFFSPFTQEFFVKSHNVRKESKGKVTFAKPGMMAWD